MTAPQTNQPTRSRLDGGTVREALRLTDHVHGDEDIPVIWYLGQWDAQVYGALIGVGIALVAWLVPDYYLRLYIFFAFIAMKPLYWYVEVKEPLKQIDMYGLLNTHQTSHQRNTMNFPIYGCILAVFIWATAPLVGLPRPPYGWLEVIVLGLSFTNALLVIFVMQPLLDNYLQATAGQRRVEREG